MSNIIILKGDPSYHELPLEALDVYGDGAITPGMLIERTADGTVQPHSGAAALAQPMFAVEFRNDGRGIDDDYAVDGEVVRYGYCQPGNWVYALLAAGSGNVTTKTSLLASNGDGTLRVSATNPVARAVEVVDNDPGTGGAAMRIKVEVL